jgi:Protein of unknown function (DUF3179)
LHFVLRRLLNFVSPSVHASYTGPLEKMIVRRSKRGGIPYYHSPLERPHWVAADRDRHTRPGDAVLGLMVDDVAFALPWWIMKNHHVANLEFGSKPLLVTLCEACASASAFVPLVDGRRHRFVVEGMYNSTPILSDFESRSLWAMFTGEALHGPLTGAQLERWPLHQSTWQEWKALYPHTLVVNGRGESRHGHGADCTDPDAKVVPGFVERTRLHYDGRLPQTALVLGVDLAPRAKAYPLDALHQLGAVLEDRIGTVEIVVFTRPGSWMSMAFRRILDGRALRFAPALDFPIADLETGTRWNVSGHAVEGPLAGRRLEFVPSGIEKWYAWFAYRPSTEVYQAPPERRESPIRTHLLRGAPGDDEIAPNHHR